MVQGNTKAKKSDAVNKKANNSKGVKKNAKKTSVKKNVKKQCTASIGRVIEEEMVAKLKKEGKPLNILGTKEKKRQQAIRQAKAAAKKKN
ncbi:hypothetical protein ABK040_016265 [Willaertia magna]